MKIYITSTSEDDLLEEVSYLLNADGSNLEFIPANQIDLTRLKRINPTVAQIYHQDSCSFESLFLICECLRLINSDINNEDFVVLLTSIRNEFNWFSATEHRNIFVDTNGWDIITRKERKYGIAYQIVENIFQSLIGISHENALGHANVHVQAIGCINDFCGDKQSITLKLRTADICEDCIKTALDNDVSKKTLLSIHNIIDSLSKKFRSLSQDDLIEPEKLTIGRNGSLTIGEKQINLEPLQKTLFIFFLKHPDGEMLDNLPNYREELFEIYRKIRRGAEISKIDNLVTHHVLDNSTFLPTKSSLNRSLKEQLGDNLAEYYVVEQDNQLYKVRLTPNYLSILPEF